MRPVDIDYRARFADVQELMTREKQRHCDWMRETEAEYKAAIEKLWRAKNPRKRKVPSFGVMYEELGEAAVAVYDRYKPIVESENSRHRVVIDGCDASGREFAAAATLACGGDVWTVARVFDDGTYSTQTSSSRYSRANAEEYSEDLQSLGLETRVVRFGGWRSSGPFGSHWYGGRWTVWANCSQLDVDIAGMKPLPASRGGLEDWAERMWRRGANPKVIAPFLPDQVFDRSMKRAMS